MAFYYDNSTPSDITYGVAAGNNEMAHGNNKIVSACFLDSKSTMALHWLFDAEGVAVEKDLPSF